MTAENRSALLAILVSITIGTLIAFAGSDGSSKIEFMPVFALCSALAFAINWLVFIPSNHAKTEHYYDLTGSFTYLIVITTAAVLSDNLDTRAMIAAALVVIWALRLGSFLFRRIKRDGRDGRFDQIKIHPLRFLMAWTMQGLWVLLTSACALAIITSNERHPLGWVSVLGIIIWAVGFGIEAIADHQKSNFKKDPANKEQFITTGLWAWSRHPNYFGEITLWVGMAIIALPVLSGWQWATLISPVFVTLLLTRVSGIPLLEQRAQAKWGDDESFQTYTKNTPVLILRPPRQMPITETKG